MKEITLRLLGYAKEFFVAGERDLEQNTNMAYMQAVLKFHDAVEYCVRTIIEEYNVNHDRNADLFSLMKSVNQSIPDKKLPLASQMDFLNATRAKIKHHASIPSVDDSQRCRLNAREFLEQAAKDYLGMDFRSVSRLLLVENPIVRQNLKAANQKRKEGDYLEALILIKKAFYAARPSTRVFLLGEPLSSLTHDLGDIRELRAPIEKIVDKIRKLEERVALSLMGVDVLKSKRFEEITPHFVFTYGSTSILWDDSVLPTEEIVEEAATYVIDIILLWQRMGLVGIEPKWPYWERKQFREIRQEKPN